MVRQLATIAALLIVVAAAEDAGSEVDCTGLIAATDDFLVEQMQRFDGARPAGQPPLTQTFGWNPDQSFPPRELNPPPECAFPPHASAPLEQMKYRGDVYDQALTALWFVERARLEFAAGHTAEGGENLARAQRLLDALIFLANGDPYSDGRLRAAYWANNLLNESGSEASIMDPAVGVGNMAYFGIALTRFYDVADDYDVAVENLYPGAPTRHEYLDVAVATAKWILEHTKDERGAGGFTGGYEGWNKPPLEQTAFTWKSTEHNIDIYVLARNLFALRGDASWRDMANHAADLVKAMYDDGCGCYLTGTTEDGVTPNPSPIPADAQAWTALARTGALEIDSVERAQKAMQWLLANLKEGCPCDLLPDEGVKFSDVGKGMQSEITASAALALLWLSPEAEQVDGFLALLDWLRRNPLLPDGVDNIAVAATGCSNGAWTGYGPDAWYYPLQHAASSAWSGFACLVREGDARANPLSPDLVDTDSDGIPDDGNGNDDPNDNPCAPGASEGCDDNCTYRANPDQADANGDGSGDVCQCGDMNGNGLVDGADLTLYKRYFGGLSSPFSTDRCGVSPAPDGGACDGADLTVVKRHFGGLSPGITNTCSAYVGP